MPLAVDGLIAGWFRSRAYPGHQKIIMSDAKLGRTAIAANLRGDKLVISVGESQAFGGVIKGSLRLAKSERAPS